MVLWDMRLMPLPNSCIGRKQIFRYIIAVLGGDDRS